MHSEEAKGLKAFRVWILEHRLADDGGNETPSAPRRRTNRSIDIVARDQRAQSGPSLWTATGEDMMDLGPGPRPDDTTTSDVDTQLTFYDLWFAQDFVTTTRKMRAPSSS